MLNHVSFQNKSVGPGAVVKAACLEGRRSMVRTPLWHSSFNETKCFFPALSLWFNIVGNLRDREVADRQIFYWQKKSHYRLICHRNERDICTCIYKNLNLLKSYDNIQTDRYFIDRNKSHYRLICHRNERDICTCIYKNLNLLKSYDNIQTDRYFIDRKKDITDLFVIEMKEIYVHVYTRILIDNIHDMTYTTKIMLSGINKIKTGYFDYMNDYYLKKLRGIAKITKRSIILPNQR